jgi:hypothetical protein
VNQWSSLLRDLYSKDEHVRSRVASELRTYDDSIVSTKLFRFDHDGDIVITGLYAHRFLEDEHR